MCMKNKDTYMIVRIQRGMLIRVVYRTVDAAVSYTHLDVYKRQKYDNRIIILNIVNKIIIYNISLQIEYYILLF